MALNNDNTPPVPFPLWTTIILFVSMLLIGIYLNFSSAINPWTKQVDTKTLEFYKAITTVFVALVAAGIAGLIQWRQWQTAHKQWQTAQQKLKFELFEKRFKVYAATTHYLRTLGSGDYDSEYTREFIETIAEAEWLFDAEIGDYLMNDFRVNANRYAAKLGLYLKDGESTVGSKYLDAASEYNTWQISDRVRRKKMFSPYLDLNRV